ncbi:molecular chaperone GrpE [Lishizhenia tianjinensis]|uniref:Protein GrpE n=1 Tax=Lishizhenia tianjinensis TaxID=477690 RepID=A0A1I7BMU6_9FLAO|nr:nucleotide exchange factor GrpE [Lishizhenia tianjinensis]SFT88499.1 molecular chaperone GrpE [Lishizhenia tianjinensis]
MAKQEDKIQEEITQEEMDAQATEQVEGQEETPQEPTWEEKYNELNDKYLRLYSDFDNFRKRNIKEKADLISNAGAGVIKDLLPILDDFERAIKSNATTEDVNGLKEGFELIANKMNNILSSKGLKMMESKETAFDADLHEAITNIPAPTEELKGKVVDVIENGYYLNDKVLRYAKVVVGQ